MKPLFVTLLGTFLHFGCLGCFNPDDCYKACHPYGVRTCNNNMVECNPPMVFCAPSPAAASASAVPKEDKRE